MSQTSLKNFCECYKKLSLLGIPLYKNDENDELGEAKQEAPYEPAFTVPESILINEKYLEYPTIGETDLSIVFEQMSCKVIRGVSDYETNVLSFWILDMFIEALMTAQRVGMEPEHQKATLLWTAYFFNYILRQNPTRKELFRHLKEVLFLPENGVNVEGSTSELKTEPNHGDCNDAAEKIWSEAWLNKELWSLPLPPVLDVFTEEEESSPTESTTFIDKESLTNSSTSHESSTSSISQRNIKHMNAILEILYRIFGRLWVYLEIQSAIHSMPNVETIDLPFKLHTPKPHPPKKVEPTPAKGGKKAAVPEKSPEELEAERQLHKQDYILPLQESDDAKALAFMLFGPPINDKKKK